MRKLLLLIAMILLLAPMVATAGPDTDEDVPQGGFVTFLITSDFAMLNPVLRNSGATALMYGASIYDNPVTGEPVGDLVTHWDISDDGLHYTMYVREGVFWTDGEPVTAADYAFTWEALKSGVLETQYTEDAQNIEEINLIDDYTVEFVMKELDCTGLNKIRLGWLPKHVYGDDYTDIMENPLNSEPTVTNGPFMFGEWVRDDHLTLLANPDYWQGKPNIDGVIFKVVPSQAVAVQQLKTGEGDMMTIPPQFLAELESESQIVKYQFMVDGYDFIAFQMGDPNDPQPRLNEDGSLNEDHPPHPIFGDKRVRQAIDYAIDRQALIEKVNFGLGELMPADVLPAIQWAFNDELEPRPYDMDMAASLLDEAGWSDTDDDGVRECHGCLYAEEGALLEATAIFSSGNEVRENIAIVLQSQLAELGFKLNIEMVERSAEFERFVSQEFDILIRGWRGMGPDPSDEFLWSPEMDKPSGGFNFVSAYMPEATEIQMNARHLPGCSLEARGELYKQAQALVAEETPYIFLWEAEDVLGYNARVKGLDPGPWSYTWNIHEWYIEE